MAKIQFKTIGQMLDFYYPKAGEVGHIQKDAPVITTTTGVYNPVFGAHAFYQLNSEANAFALLPKYPWIYTGYRAITADASSTTYGSVAENGDIPATIQPTFAEITPTAKQHAHSFDESAIMSGMVKSADDTYGGFAQLRSYFAVKHAKDIAAALMVDGDTLASNSFESIDRVTASAAYATALSWTANDIDIYDIDRSSASWADAVCHHASGVDRTLTDALIRAVLAEIEQNGGNTSFMLTGYDIKNRIMGLYEDQVRYSGVIVKDQLFSIGLNGVSTDNGIAAGIRVASVYGIPLFSSQNCAQDTISRIYFLDTSEEAGSGRPKLGISLMYPTLYFEAGMEAGLPNPYMLGRFGTEGVYFTAGELVCTVFKHQGSLRDLS